MIEILDLIFELINLIIGSPELTLHLRDIVSVVVTIRLQRVIHPRNLHLVAFLLLADLIPQLEYFVLLLTQHLLVPAQLLLLVIHSLFIVLNFSF